MEDKFLTIGLTLPDSRIKIEEEATVITRLLNHTFSIEGNNANGNKRLFDYFHIRKPYSTESEVKLLLSLIPSDLHDRLILHSHYKLFDKYNFGGFHYKPTDKSWNNNLPRDKDLIISRSCHTLSDFSYNAEFPFSYSFLSPIYDSISKTEYLSSFSLNDPQLMEITDKESVIALGGVTPTKFKNLFSAKFAGVALLGYIWSPKISIEKKIQSIKEGKIKFR